MRLSRLPVTVLLCLLGLAACAPAQAFPRPISTPEGTWSIRFTQTGGFAGVQLVVQVSSDGQLEAEDHRSGRAVSQQLPQSTMQELSRLLAQTSLPSADRLPSGCADCFIYDVEIASTTGIIQIHADDTNLTDSGAQPLIQFLGELRDRALRSAD